MYLLRNELSPFGHTLTVFHHSSKSLKLYLEKYQNEKQMVVFMATDLENILMALMFKFMKKDVLDGANVAKHVECEKDMNLLQWPLLRSRRKTTKYCNCLHLTQSAKPFSYQWLKGPH